MDGLGIAKSIQLKKGAGKKKLYITFSPSNTVEIRNEEGSLKGYYEFTGELYKWVDEMKCLQLNQLQKFGIMNIGKETRKG